MNGSDTKHTNIRIQVNPSVQKTQFAVIGHFDPQSVPDHTAARLLPGVIISDRNRSFTFGLNLFDPPKIKRISHPELIGVSPSPAKANPT